LSKFRSSNATFLAIAKRRDELQRSEIAAKENKVTLMRKYRTGELPDVQRVTLAAFLAPLGMSAAPLVFCLLVPDIDMPFRPRRKDIVSPCTLCSSQLSDVPDSVNPIFVM
jgi:hypothetical protein